MIPAPAETWIRDELARASELAPVARPPFNQVAMRGRRDARRPARRLLVVGCAALAVIAVAVLVPLTLGRCGGAVSGASTLGDAGDAWTRAAVSHVRNEGFDVKRVLFAGQIVGGSALIVDSQRGQEVFVAEESSTVDGLVPRDQLGKTAHGGLATWSYVDSGKLSYFVACQSCREAREVEISAGPIYHPDGSMTRAWR